MGSIPTGSIKDELFFFGYPKGALNIDNFETRIATYQKRDVIITDMLKSKQPKIGLALGSGGARGLASIGVIKVLEENNIPIDFIAGSSFGAVVGGAYAAMKNIKKIEGIALTTNWRQVLSLIDPSRHQGLLRGKKIKKFFESYIGKVHFKDLKIPFSVVATNLRTGEAVSINKGEVASAIRASISSPLLFRPLEQENKLLADGGLSLPVPVETVRKMGAELVIAVNLDGDFFSNNQNGTFGFYKIANNSIRILRYHLASYSAQGADLVVVPKVGGIGLDRFFVSRARKNIILSGEKAMKLLIPQLKKIIAQKTGVI